VSESEGLGYAEWGCVGKGEGGKERAKSRLLYYVTLGRFIGSVKTWEKKNQHHRTVVSSLTKYVIGVKEGGGSSFKFTKSPKERRPEKKGLGGSSKLNPQYNKEGGKPPRYRRSREPKQIRGSGHKTHLGKKV